MQWLKSAFVAGALGGMSPELARLLVRLQDGQFTEWLARLVDGPATSIAFAVAVSVFDLCSPRVDGRTRCAFRQ